MKEQYTPPKYLWNGHMDTLYPYFFRQHHVNYRRERIELPDGDFVDVDWSAPHQSDHLVILCHGLTGSSGSQYMLGMSEFANSMGWDVMNINFRSCSGEMNRKLPSYHHGQTEDLKYILEEWLINSIYKEVHLMGFSLGGNVIIKYLGVQGNQVPSYVRSAVAVSVPADLHSSSAALDKWYNFLYSYNFRRSLRPMLEKKDKMFPGVIDMSQWQEVNTWWEFDTFFTAKIFGFKDATEYYDQGSANNFIEGVKRPVLIINALNDPFLEEPSYPYRLTQKHSFVQLWTPKRGGHVGFAKGRRLPTWTEEKAIQFFRTTF